MMQMNNHSWQRTLRCALLGIFLLNTVWMPAFASSIGRDMAHFLGSLQEGHNVTRPQAVRDQTGGYYTGGSLVTRGAVRETPMAHMTLPSVKAGCGGIDLFTGGFGFVNAAQLKEALKNIANNSVTYAFMLGIDAVTPMISNEMHALQHWANDINRMNINSCETAATIVGGVWPKTDLARRHVCQTLGTATNRFSDYTSARMGCANPETFERTMNALQHDPRYQELVMKNENLAWQALHKTALFHGNTAVAEWLQSVSGTVILKTTKQGEERVTLPSIIHDNQTITALLFGGKVSIYHCDEQKACLSPTVQKTTITPEESVVVNVKKILTRLYEHVVEDKPLTEEQKVFLESTSLPLLKLLTVEAAYTEGHALSHVDTWAQMLSVDVLAHYLEESLTWTQNVSLTQAVFLSEDPAFKTFQDGIETAKHALSRFYEHNNTALWQSTRFITRAQVMEQQLTGRLTSTLTKTLMHHEQ